MSEDYDRYKENLKAEQSGLSRDDIKEAMKKEAEYSLDLENLPSVDHIWVDRGAVMSCEGANHPSHRHFKVRRVRA